MLDGLRKAGWQVGCYQPTTSNNLRYCSPNFRGSNLPLTDTGLRPDRGLPTD
jgi:hypothetical protein